MSRKDSENVAKLEALRPRFERLREARIRGAAEAERAEADLAEARKAAIEAAGTDDLTAIRRLIEARYAENTKAVDEFEAALAAVERDLAEASKAS